MLIFKDITSFAFLFIVNCLLLVSNFPECYLPKFDVSFQISLCWHAENCLMRICLRKLLRIDSLISVKLN